METHRLHSLDFFRGLFVVFMILVMSAAGGMAYPPLQLSVGAGFSVADLIFPAFLFSMGLAMWFAFEKFKRKLSAAALWRVLRRVAMLAALSFLLDFLLENWIEIWNVAHIAGYHTTVFLKNENTFVLARLAICYGIGAVLCLNFSKRNLMYLAAALLVGYHFLAQFLISPDPQSIVVQSFEQKVLTLLPMTALLIFGWLTGILIEFRRGYEGLLIRDLIFYGIVSAVVGLGWDLFFPILPAIWSSSFVLLSGGILMVIFAGCLYLVDGLGFRNGTGFFRAFGLNSLFVYLFSSLILTFLRMPTGFSADGSTQNAQTNFIEKYFAPLGSPQFASLAFGAFFVLICWLVCRFLMVRKIFFRV